MDYDDKSDFEINKLIGISLGLLIDSGKQEAYMSILSSFQVSDNAVFFDDGEWHDYCSVASDAWPIIVENKINIEWRDSLKVPPLAKGTGGNQCWHADKNPLRAAMICFLKMKDAERQ